MMNLCKSIKLISGLAVLSFFFCDAISAKGDAAPATIVSRTAEAGGVKIH
jgi:hypothetical protein